MKKTIRPVILGLGLTGGSIALLIILSVLPIDRENYQEKPFYGLMMKRIGTTLATKKPVSNSGFSVGYGKENITPHQHTALAGYGKRRGKLFTDVMDSIFVRSLVIRNNDASVAIVSADLLIMPPAITKVLEKRLPEIGFTLDNTYLGATHTHNSMGNWAGGAIGSIYGAYSDSIVQFVASKIIRSIEQAASNVLPATIYEGQIPTQHVVYNRLEEGGPIDPLLRAIEVRRQDSSRLILISHTAHATCLPSRNLSLSRDYPGKLVDNLEQKGYAFALFLAGAVGSHSCQAPPEGENYPAWVANELTNQLMANKSNLRLIKDSSLNMLRIPLALPPAQAKISKDWRLRPYLFNWIMGKQSVFITKLTIGNMTMLGTPCDFSGELNRPLDSLATLNGQSALVTSFNGGYIGYVTPLRHYDVDHYETRLMNWYGPGTGEYLVECLSELIENQEQAN